MSDADRIKRPEAEHHEAPEEKTLTAVRTHYTPSTEEENALDRSINLKTDICVVVILAIDFLWQGIAKSNIGSAGTSTMVKDAHLREDDIPSSLTWWSATYVPLQPFSTMVGRKVGPKNWIIIMMVVWGALSVAHAGIRNRGTLIALRLLLGAAESGFTPTSFYYMSTLYPKEYLGFRTGMFTGMYSVAAAFSGLIAFGTLQIDSSRLHGWQVLFVLEGSLTIVFAVVSFLMLPRNTSTAWYLSQREREHAARRMHLDVGTEEAGSHSSTSLTMGNIVDAVKDWKKLLIVVCNIFVVLPVTAFTTFLPLIVQGMGYKGVRANLMSVPPFAVGFVGLLILVYLSDRTRDRSLFIIIGETIGMIGLAVMYATKNPRLRYGFTHVCLCGAFAGGPLVATWIADNTPDAATRSVLLGINGWSNLAGIIAGQLFKAKYKPAYTFPLRTVMILVAVDVVGFIALRLLYMYTNRKRKALREQLSAEEVEQRDREQRGNHKLTFVYGY
ncbi:MFS general substrate transporter [Trichodelitschia bisporula]|uniref:MFS general substrate transporter n=1 Tax=Trichodelitschia bisporula TaxID=703511 RepID=A0A6G1HZX3_9PEZI|nr:MFS general substrate transporter [Trichodelitschia bisporula]